MRLGAGFLLELMLVQLEEKNFRRLSGFVERGRVLFKKKKDMPPKCNCHLSMQRESVVPMLLIGIFWVVKINQVTCSALFLC